jgi:hypothetical protein
VSNNLAHMPVCHCIGLDHCKGDIGCHSKIVAANIGKP